MITNVSYRNIREAKRVSMINSGLSRRCDVAPVSIRLKAPLLSVLFFALALLY